MQEDVDHDEIIESDSEYLRQIYLWEYCRKYGKFAPEDTLNGHYSGNDSQNLNSLGCKEYQSTSEAKEMAEILKDVANNQNNSGLSEKSPKKQRCEASRSENLEKNIKKVTTKEERKKKKMPK